MRKLTNYSQVRCMLMACCAFVLMSCGSLTQSATTDNPNTIKIDPANRKQQITMVGGDMERSQSALVSAKNLDEVIKWSFVDLPFNVCRVSYDKKQELVEGEKNYGLYDRTIKGMKLIKAANPQIKFWATLKSDYNGYNQENNLPDWICNDRPNTWFDCKKYAGFLADYLELMEKSGVRIDILSTAKEWTQTVSAVRARDIILHLNEICKSRGITQPQYIDAATWSTWQGVNFVNAAEKAGSIELYAGSATHNYGSGGKFQYERFVNVCNKHNLPAYAEETEYGAGGPTAGDDKPTMDAELHAYREKCELYADGIMGEVLFEIFSRGVNKESRAIYFPYNGTAHRMRTYYIMERYVNSLAGGKYYVPCDMSTFALKSQVYTMAFTSDDELFMCVINDNDTAIKSLRLAVDAKCGRWASHTTFDAELPREGATSKLRVKDSMVEFDLAPKSITFVNVDLK